MEIRKNPFVKILLSLDSNRDHRIPLPNEGMGEGALRCAKSG